MDMGYKQKTQGSRFHALQRERLIRITERKTKRMMKDEDEHKEERSRQGDMDRRGWIRTLRRNDLDFDFFGNIRRSIERFVLFLGRGSIGG